MGYMMGRGGSGGAEDDSGQGGRQGGRPVSCKLALPSANLDSEPEACLTARDVDTLAHADAEWLWRFGWRRVVPGPDDDLRAAVRPPRKADALLTRYLSRWPKPEPGYRLPEWLDEVAAAAEEEVQP